MGFKPKTCVRYNEPWHAHALTFSCYHQKPLLENPAVAMLLIESLQNARRQYAFDLWAYAIMPEHVHLIIKPRPEHYSISAILFAIKRPVSWQAKRRFCRISHPFWQPGGGYDRNLWKTKAIHREIEYLHNNPVRRGLCQCVEDWTFSSAAFWAGCRNVPLKMDETVPQREYF